MSRQRRRRASDRCVGRGRRLPAAALLALGIGCASPPPIAEFSLVTRVPGVVRPTLLQEDVEGTWCFSQDVIRVSLRPPWRARLADTGRAVEAALASVPGANVLTNVEVRARVEQYLLFQRVCAIVRGDAGRLE